MQGGSHRAHRCCSTTEGSLESALLLLYTLPGQHPCQNDPAQRPLHAQQVQRDLTYRLLGDLGRQHAQLW